METPLRDIIHFLPCAVCSGAFISCFLLCKHLLRLHAVSVWGLLMWLTPRWAFAVLLAFPLSVRF